MFDFEYELKNLPDKSGVYIMKNSDGEVIYVGKAKVLKNRVRQYFKGNKHSPKVEAMVKNIASFEYVITDSEFEALVLECNLIKEHMPKYNILLKDDKTYPFIRLSLNEMYPRLTISRSIKNDGAKYFGPYSSAILIRELIDLVKDIFKLRSCNKSFPRDIKKGRTCLYHHIGKCLGVCTGEIDEGEYNKMVAEVCNFLSGNTSNIVAELSQKMKTASENLDFERAAFYRDKLKSIELLSQKQKIVSANGQDIDAIAMSSTDKTSCVQIFFIRSGKIVGRENYFIERIEGQTEAEILGEFVKQYYAKSTFIPKELMLESEIDDMEYIKKWLSSLAGRSVNIKIPQRGENLKLIHMIKTNAKKALYENDTKMLRDISFKNNALSQLSKILELDTIIHRIEAYDMSNFAGKNNVGAMVTFIDAKPSKKDYRNFKIKSVSGSDDYACMREVLTRRLSNAKSELAKLENGEITKEDLNFGNLPDVIFLDGGIGHVNTIEKVVSMLGFNIPVFGIVKDDNHKTRGLVSADGELYIEKTSEAFRLITNIQDEMHRRAIDYQAKLGKKSSLESELENIAGVGETRRKALLKHFKTLNKIKEATLEDILKVKSIDQKTAYNICEYFKKADE